MLRSVVVALLALTACGPDKRERDPANVDAGTAGSGDAAAQQCYDSTTEVEVALQIQIEESCAIWNSLAELSGRATVSRTASTVTIDFGGGVVFSGPLVNGAVNLVYQHEHTFTDNCGWEATETLVGQLDPTTCNFSLSYDYVEAVAIDNGGCATPCSAQADVMLELTPVIL